MSRSANAPRPRRRPAPSQRDQKDLYAQYQTTGRLQAELAKEYGLTQCRVSQIIRRVDAWIAGGSAPSAGQADRPATAQATPDNNPFSAAEPAGAVGPPCGQPSNLAERERLDQLVQRERLNFVCREAVRQYQAERKTVTHKTGSRGEHSIDETTERREPPSVQFLKVILQATAQLGRQQTKHPKRPADDAKAENRQAEANQPLKPIDVSHLHAAPPLPKEDGWYYPQCNAEGHVAGWLTEAPTREQAVATAAPAPESSMTSPLTADAEGARAHSSTSAAPTAAPQASSSKALAAEEVDSEVLPDRQINLPESLRPLYEKMVRMRRMQRAGLPCTFTFDESEQRQMYLLPHIVV